MTPGNENPGSPQPDWRELRYQERMRRRAQMGAWRGPGPRGPGRVFPGLVLLIVGVLFLVSNLGIFDAREIRDYWPVLLIAMGVAHAIFPRRGARSLLWSGVLIVIGGLFLLRNFGYIHGNIWQILWPVWLIFLGLSFLFRGHWGSPVCGGAPWASRGPGGSNANKLNESSVFGGINQRVDSQDFEGGYLSSVFGGIEMDLRGANTKQDELFIQADAVFGGIDLFLPDRWDITVKGTGVFGGFEDKTHPPTGGTGEKRPHLTVTGSAVFGGVTVRN